MSYFVAGNTSAKKVHFRQLENLHNAGFFCNPGLIREGLSLFTQETFPL